MWYFCINELGYKKIPECTSGSVEKDERTVYYTSMEYSCVV